MLVLFDRAFVPGKIIDGAGISIHGHQNWRRWTRRDEMRFSSAQQYAILLLLCVICVVNLSGLWMGSYVGMGVADCKQNATSQQVHIEGQTLAVVVSLHRDDYTSAMETLRKWPTKCSPKTLQAVDLILYHAGYVDENDLMARLPSEASKCFRRTKVVNANLSDEVCH